MSVQLYTSYFSNMNFIKNNGFLPVAICRYLPKGYDGPIYQELAPSAELLNEYKETLNWERYKDRFHAELLNKDLYKVAEDLRQIAENYNNNKLVLCCYEEPRLKCHRHLVADFFNELGLLGGGVHELNGNDLAIQSVELF